MATSRDELYKAAVALDDTDRAELIGMLLDTLDTETESGVEAAWLVGIEKRIGDLDSGQVAAISWEEARIQFHRSTGA